MSIDEIARLTTIKLPEPLERKEAEELVKYIAKNLPADITYTLSAQSHIYHNPENKKFSNRQGPISISGNISSLNSAAAFEAFSTEYSFFDDVPKIISVNFMPVPGWKLHEYKPAARKLWRDVRAVVMDYFSEKK